MAQAIIQWLAANKARNALDKQIINIAPAINCLE